MSEMRDPAIKLFGKTIPLPMIEENPTLFNDGGGGGGGVNRSKEKNSSKEEARTELKDPVNNYDTKEKDGSSPPVSEETTVLTTSSSGNNEYPKTPSNDKETAVPNSSKTEEEQSETSMSDEKTLKKPEKILPCPRCNSMDTKFCYYNNYNVNQPRHFCKKCQRYWTAGGTMRNVPVGAGRRKNKNTALHSRHITVSEALQVAKANFSEGIQHPAVKRNGTVLTFGPDVPLCESMASVLSLADTTMRNCQRNGFHGAEEHRIPDSFGGEENSSRDSVTASNFTDGCRVGVQDPMMPNCLGFPQQMPCFPPGSPWPYPWNPSQWNSAVPPPGFCAPNFPMPFYPAAPYWGCAVPGNWTLPWLSQPSSSPNQASSPNQGAPGPSPYSQNLRKHSRDGDMIQRSNSDNEDQQSQTSSERSLWIPKTLRIDDPDEAARSSIWATLGIKNDIAESIGGGRLFKAFQSKGDNKNHKMEKSQLLEANPAAMSRSLNFQESS